MTPHPRIVAAQNDLISTLSKLVSCIGCRTSVERFYKQLVAANNSRRLNLTQLDKAMRKKSNFGGGGSALDPFIIRSNGDLTLKRSVLMDPQLVYNLFYLNWYYFIVFFCVHMELCFSLKLPFIPEKYNFWKEYCITPRKYYFFYLKLLFPTQKRKNNFRSEDLIISR